MNGYTEAEAEVTRWPQCRECGCLASPQAVVVHTPCQDCGCTEYEWPWQIKERAQSLQEITAGLEQTLEAAAPSAPAPCFEVYALRVLSNDDEGESRREPVQIFTDLEAAWEEAHKLGRLCEAGKWFREDVLGFDVRIVDVTATVIEGCRADRRQS